MKCLYFLFLASISTCLSASTPPTKAPLTPNAAITRMLQAHLEKYGKDEFFSAIQVSVKVKDQLNTYVAGRRSRQADSEPITPEDLFDIGSITKSFTASLALLAEGENKLKLTAPVSNYLNDYPHWGDINLNRLLNMSSGIPNYSDAPKINYLMSQNLRQFWNATDLLALVYPKNVNPPRKPGYFYSNTGYILIQLILEKIHQTPFQALITDKIIKPLDLKNTFYPVPEYPAEVSKRLVHGYSYNIYDNPELLGQDVTDNNLSWAGAAGAVVANSEDVIHWVYELFLGNKLLNAHQKEQMQTLVSLSSGLPLKITHSKEPYGFGLGIAQGFDAKIGHYWFYEGETLGYRAIYMYVPCNEIIISALFNSATNQENDHARELVQNIYHYLLQQNQLLICEKKEDEA
ncbi:serine hydrolase domain-containing protein [Legionella jordanis]|uniref:D-alanyl-D-alanine carboxypeptidase n=1 Tax=Legionella jordanis TaxID=456 RepID=A0A0W0VCB6_9GAMM|nr:serine hydrolase domain-containing protein [Legionella jordanis]KTD17754.1 D-alanyl-D-alanine carboxypeptidase [Legionella jordanis]RMX01617.1 class A beta-lactamase-related serine hydrolase [Legionella jordanis]RMX21613.1 class A beta-lactamase-related serine hydrolase [Legionella jordanis]VEH11311.1 D-alanyl-D-alanine carboxypeptidase [Legionella jordanis]